MKEEDEKDSGKKKLWPHENGGEEEDDEEKEGEEEEEWKKELYTNQTLITKQPTLYFSVSLFHFYADSERKFRRSGKESDLSCEERNKTPRKGQD